MRTNHSGVTENAEFNIDKEKFDANYLHIFRKDICPCYDCDEWRQALLENARKPAYAIKKISDLGEGDKELPDFHD
jgi:hypothetical protein